MRLSERTGHQAHWCPVLSLSDVVLECLVVIEVPRAGFSQPTPEHITNGQRGDQRCRPKTIETVIEPGSDHDARDGQDENRQLGRLERRFCFIARVGYYPHLGRANSPYISGPYVTC